MASLCTALQLRLRPSLALLGWGHCAGGKMGARQTISHGLPLAKDVGPHWTSLFYREPVCSWGDSPGLGRLAPLTVGASPF